MADENLQDESLENWWEQHEPRELAGIALKPFAPHRGPAPQSPLTPAADEQKDDSKPGPGNEPHSQVAADRSIGMDGFGVALYRLAYFASERLSENINRSPEGFLICTGCVIARTGFQKYRVSELSDPEGLLDGRRADEEVDVWRDPFEVFSPQCIASFEAKSLTLGHPSELLSVENEKLFSVGHVQNVRRGSEPLGSGDWPLLADVIVKAEDAILAVKTGMRELSCGYTYELAKRGYRLEQRRIIGNHIAIVEQGRAGSQARIYDAAISSSPKRSRMLTETQQYEIDARERGRRQVEHFRNLVRPRRPM